MKKYNRRDLNSPFEFVNKHKDYINALILLVKEKWDISFETNEFGELLLSACRSNDFGVIREEKGKLILVDEKLNQWVEEKLIPNMILVGLDDEDMRLLIFSLEITHQMFSGGTKATITQKGFRERRRNFESILVDQFIGTPN